MTTRKITHRSRGGLTFGSIIALVILALLTAACEPEQPRLAQLPPTPPGAINPQVWIEFPVEGQTVPLAAVPFVVYAADPQNVVQIDLRVNGQSLGGGQLRGVDANNGYRLARLDHAWQPPAAGQYILEARARNSAGVYGPPAYAKFCVGSCQPSAPTPTPAPRTPTWTPSPAAYPTGTPAPAKSTGTPPTLTPTLTRPPTKPIAPPPTTAVPPPQPGASINFRSDAPYVNGGSCTTLRWDVDNAQAVFLDGQAVTGHGTKQVCPCAQTTYTLRVVKRDNTAENRTVTIGVYGACAPPTAPPTTVAPDTAPPSITNTGLRWADCKFYGQATATDPSGVNWVQFHYSLNGGAWQLVRMRSIGSNRYEAETGVSIMSGIGTPSGQVEYFFSALDNRANGTQTDVKTHNYMGCGG